MNIEILFFILTSVVVIVVTIIDSWHDKLVVDSMRILKKYMSPDKISSFRSGENKWKFWGNIYALSTITLMDILLIALKHWWWAFFWIPIHWLLWSAVHDTFTGKFIMNDWWHVSSDKITQVYARMAQQSGILMFAGKIFILIIIVLSYLSLIT
jgi:hypothetical protein